VAITLEPRSVYAICGVARWDYQHSIPSLKALQYSVKKRKNESR
jgi:alkylated DNA repair dioxygenase AlkB